MVDGLRLRDDDLRRYLQVRAEAVAARAAGADEMAARLAVDMGLVRRRVRGRTGLLRLAVVMALLLALVAAAVYLVGRDRFSYAPDRPEITTVLHGAPWGVTVADGAVWVAGYREGVLFQVEPSSGDILDRKSVV